MNYILNNFLSAQDKFMLEIQLKRPRFSCSACRTSTKNKERMQNQRRKSFNISERTDIASGDLKIYLEKQLLIKYYFIRL